MRARQQPPHCCSSNGLLLLPAAWSLPPSMQLERVIARDFILVNHLPHSQLWERDGHDNNWLVTLCVHLEGSGNTHSVHGCPAGLHFSCVAAASLPPFLPVPPQLLEFVLALPFAAGYKTSAVARMLAATLAAEALTCWPFWTQWPTQSYAAHVRLHFATNLGVAGELITAASLMEHMIEWPCMQLGACMYLWTCCHLGCCRSHPQVQAGCCCWPRLERDDLLWTPCWQPRRKSSDSGGAPTRLSASCVMYRHGSLVP